MMRGEPGKRRALDEAGRDARHLAVRVDARARALQERGDVGRRVRRRRAWWNLHFGLFPLPVVPLADEASPVLNRKLARLVADAERRLLVTTNRRCEDVQAPHSGRERNRLPARNERAYSATRELKGDSAVRQLARQHLQRQGVPFTVKSRSQSLT